MAFLLKLFKKKDKKSLHNQKTFVVLAKIYKRKNNNIIN